MPRKPGSLPVQGPTYEGLPGVYSTIWILYYKTNELKKRREGNRPSLIGRKRG
jgi:hypothetical protein